MYGSVQNDDGPASPGTSLRRLSKAPCRNVQPAPGAPEGHSSDEAAQKSAPPKLRRELGLISTLALSINMILGCGVFITPSTILMQTRSFGLSMVLWVGGALTVYAASFCYLELALMVKKSGSTFIFLKEAYSFTGTKSWMKTCGSLLAFVMLWSDSIVGQPVGAAIPLLALGRYLCQPFFMECDVMPVYAVKMFSLAALMVMTIVNVYSVRISAALLTWLSYIKILALVFVIVLGMWKLIQHGSFPEDSRHPFEGSDTSPFHIALGLYGVVFTYDGWIGAVGVQEETKSTNIVKWVTYLTIPIIAILYVLTNISFFAVLSYDQISNTKAVGLLFGEAVLGKAGLAIFSLISVVLIFGGANATLFYSSREMFVAGREGFMPQFISGIQVTHRTPLMSILVVNFITAVFIMIGNIDSLLNMFSAVSWFWYGAAIFGVILMRLTRPHVERPFEVILLFPAVTTVVAILLVVLPLWQNPIPQLIGFAMTLTGVPVYVFLVMDVPYKLRPKVIDRFSAWLTSVTCKLFNMELSGAFEK